MAETNIITLCSKCKINPKLAYHAWCRPCFSSYEKAKLREKGLKGPHRNFTHRGTGTPEYRIWDTMKQRCNNPKHKKFPLYGGRGIKICARWDDFASFLSDMGPRPSPRHSIDRIDGDKGYSPDNCRWATPKQQARNVRTHPRFTYQDRTLTIAEWAEITGINTSTLYYRIVRMKWPIERALTEAINY